MDNSPGAPSGHGSEAPGIAAVNLATAAIQALKVPATAIKAAAAQGTRTTRGTPAVPSKVTGATNGAAMMFASSE